MPRSATAARFSSGLTLNVSASRIQFIALVFHTPRSQIRSFPSNGGERFRLVLLYGIFRTRQPVSLVRIEHPLNFVCIICFRKR